MEALRIVRKWLPSDSVVIVPEIHLFDEENHVIIMDDVGGDSVTLKELMIKGNVSLHMAKEIGITIGKFLGELHKWGKENKEAWKAVKGNMQAKIILAWAFYGRLKETLVGADDVPKLSFPPLEVDEQEIEIIKKVGEETTKAILDEEEKVGSL